MQRVHAVYEHQPQNEVHQELRKKISPRKTSGNKEQSYESIYLGAANNLERTDAKEFVSS